MAHTESAKKRLRQSRRTTTIHRSAKRDIKTRAKRLKEAIAQKDLSRAEALLRLVISRIDKARKNHVLHANKASRLKASLMCLYHQARAGTAPSTEKAG
jgi:small subunit ribosomal protein S20